MGHPPDIDGVLIQWGDRLIDSGIRVVKIRPQPKLSALAARQRAAAIRERIEATVVRRVPQVMVKVTGGGRGIKAIAAHFRHQQERRHRFRPTQWRAGKAQVPTAATSRAHRSKCGDEMGTDRLQGRPQLRGRGSHKFRVRPGATPVTSYLGIRRDWRDNDIGLSAPEALVPSLGLNRLPAYANSD